MATYKVLQDVEAEDKLVGPLSLRQFVYAGITGFCLYLCYFVISKGAAFLIIFLIPPAAAGAFFAFPWSKEQPTELWALARIRFLFKPRRRIWNQSGVKELVTVTAPKKIEQTFTDGLTQAQVKSRLQALASTIDSRGWAIKGGYTTPSFADTTASNDRLVNIDTLPHEVPDANADYHDMLDPANNHMAAQFDTLLTTNAQQHRQQLMNAMQQTDDQASSNQTQVPPPQTPLPADYWFMNQSPTTPTTNAPAQVVTPGAAADPYAQPAVISRAEEAALVEELKAHDTGPAREYSHLPTILPLSEQEKLAKQQAAQAASAPNDPANDNTIQQENTTQALADNNSDNPAAPKDDTNQTPAMTDGPDAAILELARNDDLNVETIARQAKKAHGGGADEVVISLH